MTSTTLVVSEAGCPAVHSDVAVLAETSFRRVPQAVQNFAPGRTAAPQFEHVFISGSYW
ncbi:MAG: hypothetical protein AVDCRST_MAG43-892 [uncultured Thermomicrobiales bacterium]|uniref:Uncharacterized protein n=1 Tax=uncultured Thermomicrobiales bacterium TaxID=1645740 RepID=A0A6J4UIG3_9BACT|nr:MAG: hypothetical protein AVDCRST_MAG43-892 [uncultured Thermomicrobiales bacterium]